MSFDEAPKLFGRVGSRLWLFELDYNASVGSSEVTECCQALGSKHGTLWAFPRAYGLSGVLSLLGHLQSSPFDSSRPKERNLPITKQPWCVQAREGVRRSWISDYMDDLWSHVRISFPRAVLYAFPFAVLIMSLLCCITILID
ncbi:small integral membrane protein 9 [Anolis carolinensis]|uniref:small integral membrane protein 9 n=1 Tax=Anolis carolinensis TaxID=28377 RepID=UPI002F2B4470